MLRIEIEKEKAAGEFRPGCHPAAPVPLYFGVRVNPIHQWY
jgi:hypothetical protein